jgi:hypothetical protein
MPLARLNMERITGLLHNLVMLRHVRRPPIDDLERAFVAIHDLILEFVKMDTAFRFFAVKNLYFSTIFF